MTRQAGTRQTGTVIESIIKKVARDLNLLEAEFALIGGLAVSIRTEPRFTRDIDLALAVTGDRQAEQIVNGMQKKGYRLLSLVEQKATGRLATARLLPEGQSENGIVVDLIFATCGVESEIVRSSTSVKVMANLTLNVANIAHLIAMKILSEDPDNRPKDSQDLVSLLAVATKSELVETKRLLKLITKRGFNRKKRLLVALQNKIRKVR